MTSVECPKCGAGVSADQGECGQCGVILAKAVSAEFAARRRRYQKINQSGRGSRDGAAAVSARSALLIGAALAVVLYVVPFTRFVLSYLAILVHELGHTAAGLLFGYPSIPSFDFFYGGGITMYFERSGVLLFLVAAAWVGAGFAFRAWPRLLGLIAALGLLWLLAAATGVHDVVMSAAGHGAELVAAGFCLVRALSGNVTHAAERWLYAMCGAFLVLSAWVFALRLIESESARAEYGAAKGGGHWMDMSRIARALDWNLDVVALVYWLGATLLPVAVHLGWINRRRMRAWLEGG